MDFRTNKKPKDKATLRQYVGILMKIITSLILIFGIINIIHGSLVSDDICFIRGQLDCIFAIVLNISTDKE